MKALEILFQHVLYLLLSACAVKSTPAFPCEQIGPRPCSIPYIEGEPIEFRLDALAIRAVFSIDQMKSFDLCLEAS